MGKTNPFSWGVVPAILVAVGLLTVAACTRDATNPLDPENPDSEAVLVAPPGIVESTSGFFAVSLSWSSVALATEYRVYRSDALQATVIDTMYRDADLVAGRTYEYQIASVHAAGLVGRRSEPIYVTTRDEAHIVYDSHTFLDFPGNGDGVINKGESIILHSTLRNVGTSSADGVVATMSINDPFVTMNPFSERASFGQIVPGGTSTENDFNAYMFTVSEDCPAGHVATLRISIEDRYQNTWTDSTTVTVDPGTPR